MIDKKMKKRGRNLKKLRALLGMNQADLALIADVHKGTVSYWETGRRSPSKKASRRILDFAIQNNIPMKMDQIRPIK